MNCTMKHTVHAKFWIFSSLERKMDFRTTKRSRSKCWTIEDNKKYQEPSFQWRGRTMDRLFQYCLMACVTMLYAYKKYPELVRITCVLCAFTWISQFYAKSSEFEPNFRFKSWVHALSRNIYTSYIVLFMVCLSFLEWKQKLTLLKGNVTDGFEHLERVAKKRNKKIENLVPDYNKFKNSPDAVHDRPIPNCWLPLLESKELDTGDHKHIKTIGINFVLIRLSSGEAEVYSSGHQQTKDMASGNRIQSKCKFKANLESNFKKWECQELNYMIFVWYHAENLAPTYCLPQIPELTDPKWSVRGQFKINTLTPVQDLMENLADNAHTDALHTENVFVHIQPKDFLRYERFISNKLSFDWEPNLNPGNSYMSNAAISFELIFADRIKIELFSGILKVVGPTFAYERFKFPILGDVIAIVLYTPEEPSKSKFVVKLFTKSFYPQFLMNIIVRASSIIIYRDVVIWNNKIYKNNPTFVKEDKKIRLFRRWYSQFYSENSPGLKTNQGEVIPSCDAQQ